MEIGRRLVWLVVLAVLMCASLAGCSDRKAAGLYDQAVSAEQRADKVEAVRLYERIIVVYPTSEYAPRAKERLDALRGGQPVGGSGPG
jgi:outer membrane protein assembly factor BamD (BamD/ComL family)